MDKVVIVEIGSTNTKVDLYSNGIVKRLDELTILFKGHYKEENKLNENDINILINKILELKKDYENIYVCGTSIFRELKENEKEEFLNSFKERTGIVFHIISQEEENNLTVLGSTRFVNDKACIFVGGGGSSEISIYDKKIIETANSKFGVMDVMNKFPDLGDDIATTSLETVMDYVRSNLTLPKEKSSILMLAGGGHEVFARHSGIYYEKNTLYEDNASPIMMDIESRRKETKRFYESISLNEIKKRVQNPDWWFATRAMCAFVLVIAEEINAKYIIPTNISMVYGIIEKLKKQTN